MDAALVKRWAKLFGDYLSADANPAKGKTRVFSDQDMLVLTYVMNEWEDDPDLGAIKIGLNREEHFAAPYIEHLYLHTPLLQDPPEGMDETWRHGILFSGGGRSHEYLELARNYRLVAESTLEQALNRDEADGWAYPVLFAYRHTLELYLKLIGEVDEVTHSLRRCVYLVEKRHGVTVPAPIRGWILELDQIDPAGTAFRYADEPGKSGSYEERWFDFQHFKFAMKQVFDALDMAILKVKAEGKMPRKRNSRRRRG